MKSVLQDILTGILILCTAIVVLIVGTIYFNPDSRLNPFPPATSTHAVTPTATPVAKPALTSTGGKETQNASPSSTPSVAPSRTPTTTEVPQTPTPSATPTGIVFAVIGDYGLAGEAEAEVARLVKSWDPDFIITTGDNNYPNGEARTIDDNIGQYYSDYIYPYTGRFQSSATKNRFFPSLGNHDWRTRDAQAYLDYFSLPGNERYYHFSIGPVSFFALDSDDHEPSGNSATSLQAQWLQLSLAASNSAWNVVYFHHAPFSSGDHGSSEMMRWPFERWGASLVISGHDHLYERLTIRGIPYIVNGAGGKSLYRFRDPLPDSIVRYNDDFGAMRVTADQFRITLEFVNRSGQIIDEFSITGVEPEPTTTPDNS